MKILYTRSSCGYCAWVMQIFDQLGLQYEVRDVDLAEYLKELLEKGGKQQVPYYIDTDKGIGLYESKDIVKFVVEEEKRSKE